MKFSLTSKNFFYRSFYVLCFLFFLIQFAQKQQPYHGFTSLLYHGSEFSERSLPSSPEEVYVHEGSGYDGQFYAQIALDPLLQDEGIQFALDSFSYRARRILFSWTAYIMGFGAPSRIVQIYAIQNAIFWIATAILLLRWLPPVSPQNAIRYAGILFCAGTIVSVDRALLDLPSLTLVLAFASLIEKNKLNSAAATLALATLGKEHSILCFLGLLKKPQLSRSYGLAILRLGFISAIPFIAWVLYVHHIDSTSGSAAGFGNFAIPLAGWVNKFHDLFKTIHKEGLSQYNLGELILSITIVLQAGWLICRPDIKKMWWRIGILNAVLVFSLGPSVLENCTHAASRVALPVVASFNLVFPRKLKWLPLLIVANLSIIPGYWILDHRLPREDIHIEFNGKPLIHPDSKKPLYLQFSDDWHIAEESGDDSWRWAKSDASIKVLNPFSYKLHAEFLFEFVTFNNRSVVVKLNNNNLSSVSLKPDTYLETHLEFELKPGINTLTFTTDAPASRNPPDNRLLSFAVRNYTMSLSDKSPKD